MSLPLVTIAIPTYNRADGYLSNAVRSAVEQTYKHLEILVVDNASADNTAEVVASFDEPRLRYIRQDENVGPFPNFQRCLQEAEGDYFLLLHDDDQIDPDFVETCVTALKGEGEIGYVRTGLRTIDEDGQTIKEWQNLPSPEGGEAAVYSWLNEESFWALCNTLYNTSLLRTIGGLPAAYPLTFDCHVSVQLAFAYGTVEVPEVKASFRTHQQQFGKGANPLKWIDEWLDLYDLILGLAPRTKRAEYRVVAGRFFRTLFYKYAANASDPLTLLRNYAVAYWKLGDHRLRPPVRETGGRIIDVTKQWIGRSTGSTA